MNKNLVVAIALIAGTQQLQAQQSINKLLGRAPVATKVNPFVEGLLQLQHRGNGTTQRPTVIKQRVIAQSMSNLQEGLLDTTRYTYSTHLRGSTFDYNSLFYNQQHQLMEPPVFTFGFGDEEIPAANFNAAQADSIIRLNLDNPSATVKSLAKYNTALKVDTLWIDDGGYESFQTNYFNNAGKPIASILWDGTDTSELRKLTYNSTFTQITADTIFYFENNVRDQQNPDIWQYNYNANNKPERILFYGFFNSTADTFGRFLFTYNTTSQLTSALSQYYSNGTFYNETKDSFAYLPNIDYNVAHYSYYYTGMSNNDEYYADRQMRSVGVNGLPDTITFDYKAPEASEYTSDATGIYSYNSYGNPEQIAVHMMVNDVMAPAPEAFIKYYYDTYEDQTSGLKDMHTQNHFVLYPNPVSDAFFINYRGENSRTEATLSIVNLLGQQIFTQKLDLNKGSNKIALPQMANGQYVFLLRKDSGETFSTKIIKK